MPNFTTLGQAAHLWEGKKDYVLGCLKETKKPTNQETYKLSEI